ncbi:restriction endonuclease subunit S [Porphyromonas levii]|nr:restriction endonuclease subunit S [Porphyromonas levii]
MTTNNNPLLNCPPLRFPEFSDPWQQTTLGAIGEIRMCKRILANQTNKEGGVPFFKIGTIGKKEDSYIPETLFHEYKSKYPYPDKGQILITCAGTIGRCLVFDGSDAYYQDSNIVWIDNEESSITNQYLFYVLNGTDWSKLNTSTIVRLYNDDLRALSISLPSLEEQRKIADFLSLIDERIETQRQTISHLYSLSMGFYLCIRNKRKVKWSKVFLRDVMTIRKEKNSKNAEVHSVSVNRGIINQIEHLGRSFAAKDTKHYNLVYNGDLVYTKSPTGQFPFGIVKQSFIKKPVAVSPLYGVYIPANIYVGRIIHSFFLSSVRATSYLASLVQKGAKNTMNITTEHFLDNEIYLPLNIEEQRKIAELLAIFDERIDAEEALLKCYEAQKRYLLRQMFV